MAKKVEQPKEPKEVSRKLSKDDKGRLKTKAGKYYQIGEHAIKADKSLKIETNKEVVEYDGVDSLPDKVKGKFKK